MFSRMSRNTLQNVMSYFDYKGQDFVKMRSINRNSKFSYMQELHKRFNADRQYKSLERGFIVKSTKGLEAFMESSLKFESEIPKQMTPHMPVKRIALQDATLSLLNELLQTSIEFQCCLKQEESFKVGEEDGPDRIRAAKVMYIITASRNFKRSFVGKFDPLNQKVSKLFR